MTGNESSSSVHSNHGPGQKWRLRSHRCFSSLDYAQSASGSPLLTARPRRNTLGNADLSNLERRRVSAASSPLIRGLNCSVFDVVITVK
ncbi:hypothetical protein MATL_G00015990 [Megalops atlanticus]|uniref:Uncharacterized protein n=1 Tax=Megalops atlanticus TaxID=7932 RepID=A0A9D3QK91_MEGAT|nr:hypothetical protein MATL_G00015990 [Megalops atlanticus]